MGTFHPRIEEAINASARMDALCEFIEFWLGPRQASFGEPSESLAAHALPTPLYRLYEFAGRWPTWQNPEQFVNVVPVFATQDNLLALSRLEVAPDGKVIFLEENQAVWDCRTLGHGEDPPVWCCGDQFDEEGELFRGERLVCDSLSRFLTSFVLQEMTFGSQVCLSDDALSALFEAQRALTTPVWTKGEYVHSNDDEFRLWGHVLVSHPWQDSYWFGANDQEGMQFLKENQSPVKMIGLLMWRPWTLEIGSDGSARLRYLKDQTDEFVDAPAKTFDFVEVLEILKNATSQQGHHERNPMVFFRRQGQASSTAQHLHDTRMVTSLFQRTLQQAIRPNRALTKRYHTEWPL